MNNRSKFIESLATGNLKSILENLPEKYFFWVWDIGDKYVDISDRTTDPPTHVTRSYSDNWEDCLTPREKKYLKQCDITGRICCIILSTVKEPKDNL